MAVTPSLRKAVIRLLHRPPDAARRPRAACPRVYGPAIAATAQVLWEAVGQIGATRLYLFVPELLQGLTRCGELALSADTVALLRQANPASLQRVLAPARATRPPGGQSTTRAGTWLKSQIPVRPVADWDETRAGATVRRVYDRAQMPYQRLCAASGLTPSNRQELYQSLNLLRLRRQIETELDRV